jgi:hypothetical protein
MGSHRTKALIACMLMSTAVATGQEPGWHYSPLAGEGDRASMGCARGSTAEDFVCLVVRCEEDFSTGLYVHASRPQNRVGAWEMTLDREARTLQAREDGAPYGVRLEDTDGWLLDGLRHGTFVYLRHADDTGADFEFIDLGGSFQSIAEALYWCAPRVEQSAEPGVEPATDNGEAQ